MWQTPTGIDRPSSDTYVQKISQIPENYRVLERIPLHHEKIPITFESLQKDDDATTIIIVDLETTGMEFDDKIIEICMLKCTYNQDGQLSSIDEILSMLQDPDEPIHENITNLTGITDDMVQGKQIDWDMVQDMLKCDDISAVVAHNASFDRPRFEKMCPNDLPWRCTVQEIPWRMFGHNTSNLGDIMMREGWFFDAHRAHNDCLATAWMLHVIPGTLHSLLEPKWKIKVFNAFDIKDQLKSRGYKWYNPEKYWWTYTSDYEYEYEYLEDLQSNYMVKRQNTDPRKMYKEFK